jgi:hypothetical protein
MPEKPPVSGPKIKAVHIHIRQDGAEDRQQPEAQGHLAFEKSLPQRKRDKSVTKGGRHFSDCWLLVARCWFLSSLVPLRKPETSNHFLYRAAL